MKQIREHWIQIVVLLNIIINFSFLLIGSLINGVMSMDPNWITAIFTSVLAIVTGVLAYYTFRAANAASDSAYKTSEIAQNSIFIDLMKEYSSDGMFQAMKVLGEFETKNIDKYTEWFKQGNGISKEEKEYYDEVDCARRKVSHYFTNAYRYHEKKILTVEQLNSILELEGIKLYFNPVELLEKGKGVADKTSYNESYFKAIYDRVKEKGIERPLARKEEG